MQKRKKKESRHTPYTFHKKWTQKGNDNQKSKPEKTGVYKNHEYCTFLFGKHVLYIQTYIWNECAYKPSLVVKDLTERRRPLPRYVIRKHIMTPEEKFDHRCAYRSICLIGLRKDKTPDRLVFLRSETALYCWRNTARKRRAYLEGSEEWCYSLRLLQPLSLAPGWQMRTRSKRGEGGREGKVVTAKQRSESQFSLQARRTNLPSVPSTLVRLDTLFLSYIGSGQWIFFFKRKKLCISDFLKNFTYWSRSSNAI